MSVQLLFLEFNEVNFEDVRYYCERGRLPHLAAMIESHGWLETTSELAYEHLEPWIQWVTAHTGKTYAEHGVFRLGDIVQSDLSQIWESVEALGLRVGAMSPMNASNRMKNAAFFVPDPWTRTHVSGRKRLRRLHSAIAQAVNDNAKAKLTGKSVAYLLESMLAYVSPSRYPLYLRLARRSLDGPWRRAILLDVFLADVFMKEVARTGAQFATLFLNSAAHIQHHYLFSSQCYQGAQRNPPWYVTRGADPVLEVYEAYDGILGALRRAFPSARVMIATGLHQDPHGSVTYYWRLKKHDEFLRKIDVPFVEVEPRMSRDFLVKCADRDQAARADARLSQAVARDGTPLFEVDNRGSDLFVMLVYPHEIASGFEFRIGDETFTKLEDDVAFVALKNGQHNGIGYFLDSEEKFSRADAPIPLATIPERILNALRLPAEAEVSGQAKVGADCFERQMRCARCPRIGESRL